VNTTNVLWWARTDQIWPRGSVGSGPPVVAVRPSAKGCPVMINSRCETRRLSGCGRSDRHREVAHEGDSAGGVIDGASFTAAVAQHVPELHVRQGVFHASADTFVDSVEGLLPLREFAAGPGVCGKA
jgi:hypothetical protein